MAGSKVTARAFPVVTWLQFGAAAAGLGLALATAPSALADDGTVSGGSGSATSARPSGVTRGAHQPAVRSGTAAAARRGDSGAQAAAAVKAPAAAPRPSAAVTSRASAAPTAPNAAAAKATASSSTNVVGKVSAFFGLPGAPATAAPTINSFSLRTRLVLDDLFGGSTPTVTNPTVVVTGLFHQILRADPTADELQNYLNVYKRSGVNGVVAGLYSSTAFRQSEVNNYYLELLGRTATANELGWGATKLIWGQTEPMFAASLAGSQEFYDFSSTSGGQNGVLPSATTFVNLLYRSMLGQTANPIDAPIYIQQTQAGTPTSRTATEFVTANPFRTVKVGEIYSVVGDVATAGEDPAVTAARTKAINDAVANWFRDGGLAGIATAKLASAANITRIEATGAPLPDLASANQLEQLLLATYNDSPTGFTKALNAALHTIPGGGTCDEAGPACNTDLLEFIQTAGSDRGIPNIALKTTPMAVNVQALIPTQNEVAVSNSLKFPLTDPTTLGLYFGGGIIKPPTGATDSTSTSVLTSDGGRYIVDGHHRWSAIFVINPNAQVTAIDISYVPSPQTGLKETQLGIAAQTKTIKTSDAKGLNLFTVTQPVFNDAVYGYVVGTFEAANQIVDNWDPNQQHTPEEIQAYKDALKAQVNQLGVGNVFAANLGLSPISDKLPTDIQVEQLKLLMPDIDKYLWKNVEQMRTYNQPVQDAPSRSVMPQGEPIAPILQYMSGGTLSYSFPLVSYLG